MKHRLFRTIFIGYFVLVAAPALAGEKVSGRALFSVTPLTTIPIGLIEDEHVLRHATARGSQMEFTGADLLKDCSLVQTGTCDLVLGRGSCFGYQIWVSSNGDYLVAKYSGVVLPEGNGDKALPDTVLRGSWVYVNGSGIFAGVKGAGVYRGRYTSATEYTLEWNGEIERRRVAKPHESNPEER